MRPGDASASDEKIWREAVAVCEAEDIRRPQRIQAHGALLVADADGRITNPSANASEMLGRPVRAGGTVDDLLGAQAWGAVGSILRDAAARGRPMPLPAGALTPLIERRFETLAHGSAGAVILEFIPREPEPPLAPLAAAPAANDVFRHCSLRAERVAELTGFDRVMIYRFHPDASGEVIAEHRKPELIPYLGLRYPATDIPSQARALYLENLLRLVPNIYAPTAPLMEAEVADLGRATLRAVSPYHIEYLHNMQVTATLTLSLVVDGGLWGLVSCHHGRERMLSHARQEAALAEATALSEALAHLAAEEADTARRTISALRSRWTHRITRQSSVASLLSGLGSVVSDLGADGGAIVCGADCLGMGATPGMDWLTAAARKAAGGPAGRVLATERLLDLEDLAPTPVSAGAMIARIDSDPPATLFMFRRAQVREVHWGGDPRAPLMVSHTDGRPSPRQSFALWRERVKDRGRPWTPVEQELFQICVQALEARLRRDPACTHLRAEMAQVSTIYSQVADSHRLLVNALPEGVAVLLWAVSQAGSRLLYANLAFSALCGLDGSDLMDRDPYDVLQGAQLEASVLDLEDGEEREFDVWSPALGVRRIRARREALVRHRSGGTRCEIQSLLLSDITGASRTHEALLSAVRQAQNAERARTALLRNMSHELRTPLNAILGYSDMIAQELVGPLGDVGYRDAAEEIRASATHLLALINGTLEVARLREGHVRLQSADHSLGEILLSATRLVQPLAVSKGVVLTPVTPDDDIVGSVDEVALRQILINLVNNGVKFTPQGGNVEVELVQSETGGASFTVKDTGIGMPADALSRLFIPFSQIDSSISRSNSGTGLGLSIVKELIQLHGGRVDVVSTENAGSTFTVHLPAWRIRKAS